MKNKNFWGTEYKRNVFFHIKIDQSVGKLILCSMTLMNYLCLSYFSLGIINKAYAETAFSSNAMKIINMHSQTSKDNCDCNSSDHNTPCTGRSISKEVNASDINGVNSADASFTWSFNSEGSSATCGRFANGDYWIAPAIGKSSVTITDITGSGPISVDADPIMEKMGLLNGLNNYGNFFAVENIVPVLPKSFNKTTSLVAAILRNEVITGKCGTKAIEGECVDAYNVVTILDSVPKNSGQDMIRPNITGENKDLLFLSDFDFNKLPSLTYLEGTNAEGFESIRQRWSHSTEIFGLHYDIGKGYSEGGRAFRSHILIHNYGAGMASQWVNDLMVLFSVANTDSEKQQALAAMISYGLDIYHAVYDTPTDVTRYWGQGATQSAGKFLPAVFMAALMKDQKYANKLKLEGEKVHDIEGSGPHELGQVHVGQQFPVWGDVVFGSLEEGAYWGSLLASKCYDGAIGDCNINIGKKTGRDPYGYIDGPPNKPGAGYLSSTLGVQRGMLAVMSLIPEVCNIINYKPLIDYVDRFENYGLKTIEDQCVTPDSRESDLCDTYREKDCLYYKVTWGPDPAQPGSCITTAITPYTKVGRFTQYDNMKVSMTYTSQQVEKNWAQIRANSSCK